jgi:hypothetical protein
MTNLQIRIEELLFEGLTEVEIAEKLGISIEEVEAQITIIEELDYAYDDGMDGDFESAMASAGFGTDEDYGYYGDE